MKNLFKIIAVSAMLMFATASTTYAQQKFGHVNSQAIFYAMPEVQTIQTKLQAKSQEYENQLKVMYTQYETLANEIQTQGPTMMKVLLESKYNELYALEERIVKFEQQAQEAIIAYEAELIKPVEQVAINAIKQVAAANGYTYVIDSSLGVFLVLPDSDDLTNMVKAQLGIAY